MKNHQPPEILWGFGLNQKEAGKIKDSLGEAFTLKNFSERELPEGEFLSLYEKPSATWIPLRVWNELPESRRSAYREIESTQRILIQDDSQKNVDLESILEDGFFAIVSSPLTSSKVQDVLFRAKEVSGLYGDLYKMTQEIIMERELLARKTEQLMFLNNVMSNASKQLEIPEIIGQAAIDLKMLLPVLSVQGVLWNSPCSKSEVDADIYINPGMLGEIQDEWLAFMLENVSSMTGKSIGSYQLFETVNKNKNSMVYGPNAGRMLALPLTARGDKIGSLIILCDKNVRLAKDQVITLNTAVSHLSMALSNAQLFNKIRTRADKDGLTRVNNRRSFDERLKEEFNRHQRLNMDLSLLMIDLDHFKEVNDKYGHLAGDHVLEKVAKIFEQSLRSTDFIARYGGEEFVIILPHTHLEQAEVLAKRIRETIEDLSIRYLDESFKITISIGVAESHPSNTTKEIDLIAKADSALYEAKKLGRNRVYSFEEK